MNAHSQASALASAWSRVLGLCAVGGVPTLPRLWARRVAPDARGGAPRDAVVAAAAEDREDPIAATDE